MQVKERKNNANMADVDKYYSKNEVNRCATKWFGGDELAADVWVRKYALKKDNNHYVERTPDEMFDRMANALSSVETDNKDYWRGLFRDSLAGFDKVVMQGSPMMGLGNTFYKSTLSNCYVVPIKGDSIKDIFGALYEMAQIQAFRGGVGVDVSGLRPEGAPVGNSALISSGSWSWCDLFSYVSRIIGQNGRQGALMLTLDVSHPDIEKFISMKSDLNKVTGANVSVKLTDEFMHAVENDDMFDLKFEFKDEKYENIVRTVRARDIWDKIIYYATNFAEPGLLMWDNILKTSPADCYPAFKTISTNPCAEVPLSAYDSCRLTSMNLTGFVADPFTTSATFDFEDFEKLIAVAVRMLDNMVTIDIDLQPFEDQKRVARLGRRLGLGTHGLGDMLAMLNLKYDSDEAIEFVDKLYDFFKCAAYKASINLAKERGPFPLWNKEAEINHPYINSLPQSVLDLMHKHGRRNVAMLTCAPTGSVSTVCQTSSGIEPIYRIWYDRRIKLTGADKTRATEVDDLGDHWLTYRVLHHAFKRANQDANVDNLTKNELSALVDENPAWVTADKIGWEKRIDIQSAITKHIDHAISSTINLPKGTTADKVGDIYLRAWKMGLKGVTVYVEGCRDGVLISDDNNNIAKASNRPDSLTARAHVIGSNGDRYTVFIGLRDDKPYEVFCCKHAVAGVSDGLDGEIIRVRRGQYNFESGPLLIRNINDNEDNEASTFTRLISTSLRGGIPLDEINEQVEKSKGSLTSIGKALNRVLAKYLGTVKGRRCPECSGINTVYEEGCIRCVDCAYAKCG